MKVYKGLPMCQSAKKITPNDDLSVALMSILKMHSAREQQQRQMHTIATAEIIIEAFSGYLKTNTLLNKH